jgi:hypothetical protein
MYNDADDLIHRGRRLMGQYKFRVNSPRAILWLELELEHHDCGWKTVEERAVDDSTAESSVPEPPYDLASLSYYQLIYQLPQAAAFLSLQVRTCISFLLGLLLISIALNIVISSPSVS